MNFDQLCKDFSERKPKGPMTCRVPFFKVKWEDGRKSANDLLRDFLRTHGYEYINTIDGTVWFLLCGHWRCCQYEADGDDVQFYMCEFIDN